VYDIRNKQLSYSCFLNVTYKSLVTEQRRSFTHALPLIRGLLRCSVTRDLFFCIWNARVTILYILSFTYPIWLKLFFFRCLWINYRLSVILRYLNFIVLELCPLIMHKMYFFTGFPILSYVPCIYLDQLFWTMFRFIKYRSSVIF
jgi:hypothetical protein